MDVKGQYSIEYMLILGFSIIVAFSILPTIVDINELNTMMAAAHNGALLGSEMDSFAIYPQETFNDYEHIHPRLKTGSKIVFIGLKYKKLGYDSTYKRSKIKLTIYASAISVKYYEDRNCIGDRINFYARKSICETFNTENLTNIYYNPAFSKRYYITTTEVEWV